MPPTEVTLVIPESAVAVTKEAAEQLTGTTGTPKQLLAALVKQDVIRWKRQHEAQSGPEIT